jgi:predicted ATPase
LRRLGIFAGGWSLEAVGPVCLSDLPELDALEGLTSLLDQSLIRRASVDAAEPRFVMLHVVREFALEQLAAAGEENVVRRASARYFHDLAKRAGAARGTEQERRYERLSLELNNLRAILAWATSDARQPVDLDEALDLAGTLWFYWCWRRWSLHTEWRDLVMTDWRSSANMKLTVDGELVSKVEPGSAGVWGWLTGPVASEQRARSG